MSLTNPKTVVTEQRLAEFYQEIFPYLGGMPEALANKFNKSDLYSTEEKIIGCWIDGKPLYQKTINFGNGPTADGSKEYQHNILNIERFVSFNCIGSQLSNSSICWPVPYCTVDSKNISIYANSTKITLASKSDQSSCNYIITLQYTKTTDQAGAFNIGTDTDYSLDEKIIGTWINGKPVYQKTFTDTVPTFTSPNNSALDPATLNIAMNCSVDVFISVSGFVQTVAGNYVPFPFTETTKNITYKESSSATTLNSYSPTITAFGRPNASTSMPNNIRVVNMNQNFNDRPLWVTAQYTKTTD